MQLIGIKGYRWQDLWYCIDQHITDSIRCRATTDAISKIFYFLVEDMICMILVSFEYGVSLLLKTLIIVLALYFASGFTLNIIEIIGNIFEYIRYFL